MIKNIFRRINIVIKYVWKINKPYIILNFISLLLTSIFNVYNIYILKVLINSIMILNYNQFIKVAVIMLSINITVILINSFIGSYISPILQSRINQKVKIDIFNKVRTLEIDNFDNQEFYDEYYFVLNNAQSSIFGLIDILRSMLTNIFSSIGIVSIIIYYNKISVFLIFLGVIISTYFSFKIKKLKFNSELELIHEYCLHIRPVESIFRPLSASK